MKDPGAKLGALVKRVEAIKKQIKQLYSIGTPETRGQIEGIVGGFIESVGDLPATCS